MLKKSARSKFFAVVKANSYGHGEGIIPYLNPYADGYAVATGEEADRLCRLGILKPVLILGQCSSVPSFPNIIPTAYDFDSLRAFRCPVNIKLDTGMNRLGFKAEDRQRLKETLCGESISVYSIFSHIYNAEGDIGSAKAQIELFDSYRKFLGISAYAHIFASNFLYFEGGHYDLVRCGLAMYGYSQLPIDLSPVMSVYADIVEIKRVEKNENIGYGDCKSDRDRLIAIVRAGYGDGYRRRSGEDRYVGVRGKLCPVVGQVCMDMTMIDVSSVGSQVRKGDKAYFIGENAGIDMLCGCYRTIDYEVLTSFNERVKRIYVE